MTATMSTADHTHATVQPDARARRRARRMVYESCLITKVPSGIVDDAMGVAADLVSEMVAQTGEPVRIEVQASVDEVTLRVYDGAGHESTASVHHDTLGRSS